MTGRLRGWLRDRLAKPSPIIVQHIELSDEDARRFAEQFARVIRDGRTRWLR